MKPEVVSNTQDAILAHLTSLSDDVQQCLVNMETLRTRQDTMTSVMAEMKACNDKLMLKVSDDQENVVRAMDNITGSMVTVAEVVKNMQPILTAMSKDVQRNCFDRRAQMTAGMAKLLRYVKCDDLTQAWQAFMACVGVRRGLSVMALDNIAQAREGPEDKVVHPYQICLKTVFTYKVLSHFTQGGTK
jgi:hypothetical protein